MNLGAFIASLFRIENAKLRRENAQLRQTCAELERSLSRAQITNVALADALVEADQATLQARADAEAAEARRAAWLAITS